MRKLILRWKAETPSFFKKVLRVSLVLGGAAGAILTIHETKGYPISSFVLSSCEHLIYVAGAVAAVAKFAKVEDGQ